MSSMGRYLEPEPLTPHGVRPGGFPGAARPLGFLRRGAHLAAVSDPEPREIVFTRSGPKTERMVARSDQ